MTHRLVVVLFSGLLHSVWQGLVLHAAGRVVLWRVQAPAQRYLLLLAAQLALPVTFVATIVHELGQRGPGSAPLVPGRLALDVASSAWSSTSMATTVAVWAGGLLLMALRFGRDCWAIERLRRRAAPLTGWQPSVERCAAALGLRRRVGICEAGAVDSPLAFGWLQPLILLPLGWAAQLPPAVVEAAIWHELVHIRRHDYALNVAQRAVEALFFFHPSVWWLSARVRRERELCCDQIVAEAHVDPLDYAAALVALEERRGGVPAGAEALSLAASRGDLSVRIEQILALRGPRRDPRRGLGAGVAVLLLGVAAALAACLEAEDPGARSPVSAEELDRAAPSAAVASAALRPRWLPENVARFGSAIESAALAHGVDPALLAVVVWVESRGNPEAVSPRGALGLMQIMPTTAASIAAERGLPPPAPAALREPAYNLDFGAYFLAQQLAAFPARPEPERVELAAIAYNAGPRLLRAHLAGLAALPAETVSYSALVSELYEDRDAESSEVYRTLVPR